MPLFFDVLADENARYKRNAYNTLRQDLTV